MDQQATVALAARLQEVTTKLNEVVDYISENVAREEQAPYLRAIGDILAILTDELKSRLVIANPVLHEELFRGLPRNAPEEFLRMSRGAQSKE